MDWFRNVPNVIRSQSSQSDHSGGRNSSDNTYNSSDNTNDILNRTAKHNSDSRRTSRDNSNEQFGAGGSNAKTLALARFMNSAAEQKKKSALARDDLACALCGELYTDPRLLPCLHSFCKRCLEHTVNPRSTTLVCHLCRKEVTLKVIKYILYLYGRSKGKSKITSGVCEL